LEGKYHDSYWTAELFEGQGPNKKLQAVIRELVDQSAPHRDFFHRIRSEGGNVSFSVAWFFDGQSGDVFDCDRWRVSRISRSTYRLLYTRPTRHRYSHS
jgi:hypothetical protein